MEWKLSLRIDEEGYVTHWAATLYEDDGSVSGIMTCPSFLGTLVEALESVTQALGVHVHVERPV